MVDNHGVTRHEFTAAGPNQLWLSEITEHWTSGGKQYLWAIKDDSSNRIMSSSTDFPDEVPIALAALEKR